MKTKTAVLNGKPDAGNPHVRFDEWEVASAKPRRGSLLYKYASLLTSIFVSAACSASTFTWTGATDTDWATASNWSVDAVEASVCPGAGDDISVPKVTNQPKIPAGTWPATGRYGSFAVLKGATVTCLGDKTVVNEASGGTENRPHGIGVTIKCDSVSIAGTLSANGQGFSNTDAKRPNPGQGSNMGGVHGNVIYNGKNLFTQYGVTSGAVPYGDPAAPTALGDADKDNAGTGGGAIKLDVLEDLALTGTVSANSSGRAAGGSVWLAVGGTFSGTGSVRADAVSSTRNGSGGRIAITYGEKTFTGLVSALSPDGTSNSGSGTLWEPMRYPKGSADAPADVTIDGSYVYLVPDDEVRYWNLTVVAKDSAGAQINAELHGGKIAFGTLAVNGNLKMDSWWDGCPDDVGIVSIGSIEIGASARLSLPGVQVLPTVTADSISVAAGGVLYVGWGDTNAVNEAAGGTPAHPFGRGQTVVCKTLDLAGTISAAGRGFGTIDPLPNGKASMQGAGHGGRASGSNSTQLSAYGSLSRPTELAEACYDGQNYAAYQYGGGGAVRLVVDELNLDGGTVSALASLARSAGGSVWVQAKTANGAGTLDAHSNDGTQTSGGGRVAFEYVNGNPSVSYVIGGATKAYPGTAFVAHQASADAFATDPAKPDLTSVYSRQSGDSTTFPDASQKTETSGLFVTREVSAWSVRSGTFEWTEKSYTAYPVESVPTVTPLENLATYTLSNLQPGKKYQIKINDIVQTFDGKNFIRSDEEGRITFQATLAASDTPTAISVKCLSIGGLILLFK